MAYTAAKNKSQQKLKGVISFAQLVDQGNARPHGIQLMDVTGAEKALQERARGLDEK